MVFIECELFHDKRRNLIVYGKLIVDCIGIESWWHLLNEISSTIREELENLINERFYFIIPEL
jgi:hypothetical protein